MKLTDITAQINPARDINLGFTDLQEWLDWQERLHFTAIELGLDRCRKVAELMRLLPPTYFVISIAGTNGKGSTAVMLENILRTAGYRVGIYTSPHLIRYNERIKVNGTEVSDKNLCAAFSRINQARGNISLTYFEFGTLAAMEVFRDGKVDVAIMEVGMGGRLDAVNMLDANISVISTIDLDHEQWLGYDRNAIGREKAGIFRSMRPAICADPNPPATIAETADIVGAQLLSSGQDFTYEGTESGWSWRSGMTHFNRLPVPGNHAYQIQNAAAVLMVLQAMSDYFPVSQQVVFESLRNFRMPGRFQVIPAEVPYILDVAHNPQSATMLAANIAALPVTGRVHMVLGMLRDKNHADFMRELLPCVDHWYLSTLATPRGACSSDLADTLRMLDQQVDFVEFDDIATAIQAAQSASGPGDRIIVSGSFVTVGDAIRHLGIEV